MQGDRFYLEIQGNKVQINEPWDFSNVDFTIKQDKEYFYRDLAFGGNKAELMFTKARHEEALTLLIQEAKANGSNAEVYFYYNDDIRLRLDFKTAETNEYDYFSCQGIKDTVLDILNDNKSVKVDLLSDKDIFENNAPKLQLRRTYASAMGVSRVSKWQNTSQITQRLVPSNGAMLNTFANILISEIKDTYTTGILAVMGINHNNLKRFQLVNFKDNYKDLKINTHIKAKVVTVSSTNFYSLELVATILDASQNSKKRFVIYSSSNGRNITIDKEIKNISLGVIDRGDYLCLSWELKGNSAIDFTDNMGYFSIVGDGFAFGSIINTNTYQNCINNLIKKIVPTANCKFNIDSNFQANNLLFSGNQIRFGEDKPFMLTWKDVTEQLKEFGLGYRLEGNTVVFDNIESFYKDELIHHFNNVNSYEDFKITEDEAYSINTFEYKYKKYQALKENSIEGNAGTTNGESQWYIKNKFTDSSLKIDLPISRDKFLLENTRIQALAYNENTSTQDDSTLYLFNKNNGSVVVNETAFLRATFQEDSGRQSFSVQNSEFSWLKIGVTYGSLIYFNIESNFHEYAIVEISDNTIICARINHNIISNTDAQFNFYFDSRSDYNINVSSSNNNKSIRQNLANMRAYLNTYNYYTNAPITNREYKEDASFTINGITETDPIPFFDPFKLTPKILEFKTVDKFEVYKLIEQNINGYCTVHDLKGELIRFYIKELNLRVLECSNAEYEIKGQIYDTVL